MTHRLQHANIAIAMVFCGSMCAVDDALTLRSGYDVVGHIVDQDEHVIRILPAGMDTTVTVERGRVLRWNEADSAALSPNMAAAEHDGSHPRLSVVVAACYDVYAIRSTGTSNVTGERFAIEEETREWGSLVLARCVWQVGPDRCGPIYGTGIGVTDGGQFRRIEPVLIGGWAWHNGTVRVAGTVDVGWSFARFQRVADVIDEVDGSVVDSIDACADLHGPMLAMQVEALRVVGRWSYGFMVGVSVRSLYGEARYVSDAGFFTVEDEFNGLPVWSPCAGLSIGAVW